MKRLTSVPVSADPRVILAVCDYTCGVADVGIGGGGGGGGGGGDEIFCWERTGVDTGGIGFDDANISLRGWSGRGLHCEGTTEGGVAGCAVGVGATDSVSLISAHVSVDC